MSTLASFVPVAAAVLLAPSGSGDEYYFCEDDVRWGSHYRATANTRFAVGYEGERTTQYQMTWAQGPSEPTLVAVEWSRLPLNMESLPPPDELAFGIKMPRRIQGGTILLIPADGELLPVPVQKATVTYHKPIATTWVKITDPAHRSRLLERGGWRFAAIDSKGKVAAQGPLNLPDRAGMEIRYRPLAASLRAKAAAYESACHFEPPTEMR